MLPFPFQLQPYLWEPISRTKLFSPPALLFLYSISKEWYLSSANTISFHLTSVSKANLGTSLGLFPRMLDPCSEIAWLTDQRNRAFLCLYPISQETWQVAKYSNQASIYTFSILLHSLLSQEWRVVVFLPESDPWCRGTETGGVYQLFSLTTPH